MVKKMAEMMVRNEYMYNRSFRVYVDEYCKENKCTLEEALVHEDVKRAFRHYSDV